MKPTRWRLAFIGLALCPLLISEIAIIFGWWMFFPKNGLLSFALTSSGLIEDKVSLMYTEFAALVGLVYLTLPFCFFILLSVLDGIDKRMLEAANDLGASPLTCFREVLMPLTRNGLIVAFSQCLIVTMGTYATPSALGPDTLWTVGYLIQEQMLGRNNWPVAAALSMVLVVLVGSMMILTRALSTRKTSYAIRTGIDRALVVGHDLAGGWHGAFGATEASDALTTFVLQGPAMSAGLLRLGEISLTRPSASATFLFAGYRGVLYQHEAALRLHVSRPLAPAFAGHLEAVLADMTA